MVARVLVPVLTCGEMRPHPQHRATTGTYPSCQRCCAASASHSGKTKGARPSHIRPSALAPTDHPASCLASRLRLMSIRCISWVVARNPTDLIVELGNALNGGNLKFTKTKKNSNI